MATLELDDHGREVVYCEDYPIPYQCWVLQRDKKCPHPRECKRYEVSGV